jgi:ATP phosphoribosyltransferase
VGLPKGSLLEATLDLFKKAGFNISHSSRSYKPKIDDPEVVLRLLRAQEMSHYVEEGFLDCGITGHDWVMENNSQVEALADLAYSKATSNPVRWVIAVPEDSHYQSVKDLQGKRIATEAVGLTRGYLAKHGVEAKVEFSWGATEVKVPDLVDAIVDITETGNSLRANKLRILETIVESYPQFIASQQAAADPWKREKMERMLVLLKGALLARNKVGLKLNIPEEKLQNLVETLPSLRKPTVSRLSEEGWLAVEVVIDEHTVRALIPELKALGAIDIIEYPLNKVIP